MALLRLALRDAHLPGWLVAGMWLWLVAGAVCVSGRALRWLRVSVQHDVGFFLLCGMRASRVAASTVRGLSCALAEH